MTTKTIEAERARATADERPGEAGEEAVGRGRGGRMSRQRKTAAVLRLLRGEDLETVSRSLGATAATVSGWRDAFLAAGEAALTAKPATGEELATDRLKAKVGELTIEGELLREKIARLEAGRPLAWRRPKR
jgi:transposase